MRACDSPDPGSAARKSGWIIAATGMVLVAGLAGCATVYEGKYAFRDGWRRATVTRVVPGGLLRHTNYWECTRSLSAEQVSSKNFTVVWYVSAKSKQYFAVEADPTGLSAGMRVYVNIEDCAQPPILRPSLAGGSP